MTDTLILQWLEAQAKAEDVLSSAMELLDGEDSEACTPAQAGLVVVGCLQHVLVAVTTTVQVMTLAAANEDIRDAVVRVAQEAGYGGGEHDA